MIDGILTAMHGLRTVMGRPQKWAGITPPMIFRSAEGWKPQLVENCRMPRIKARMTAPDHSLAFNTTLGRFRG